MQKKSTLLTIIFGITSVILLVCLSIWVSEYNAIFVNDDASKGLVSAALVCDIIAVLLTITIIVLVFMKKDLEKYIKIPPVLLIAIFLTIGSLFQAANMFSLNVNDTNLKVLLGFLFLIPFFLGSYGIYDIVAYQLVKKQNI